MALMLPHGDVYSSAERTGRQTLTLTGEVGDSKLEMKKAHTCTELSKQVIPV